MTDIASLQTLNGVRRRSGPVGRVLLNSGYALTALPVAVLFFTLVVTGLALGLSLALLVGGLFVLAATAYVARGYAVIERVRLREWLGRDVPNPLYLRARPGDSRWSRALRPLRDPQSWLDVVGAVLGLPTAVIAFAIAVVWWAGTLGGLTYWFWQRYLPQSPDEHGLAYYLGFGNGRTAESLVDLALGVVLALTLPLAVRVAAVLHGGPAAVLLGSRGQLQREVAQVTLGRDAARDAEASSLRRLERDIHDGPQQRLVRLGMDIGRARLQLAEDPGAAATILDSAVAQAREAVAELRALSRGIAPPLLVDRGLAVAIEEMIAQTTLPVDARLDVPAGLAPHVETAAYFTVAEALTNVAKHSAAQSASVTVAPMGDRLHVAIGDDGIGGAHVAKGQGLAGLRRRIEGTDGSLQVDSPEGGPTIVVASIPMGRRG